MSDTFITADEHYGHENIIEYCNRPFANVDEMREALIARHNAKVPDSKNALTIHVGDMFWRTLSSKDVHDILDRLHGRHAYVWGNHEEVFERGDDIHKRFDWLRDRHTLRFNKRQITLDHYAMRVWSRSHNGSWMLYGHSHGELPEVGLSFDIGVDSHNFEPWSLEEIAEKMATKISNHVITPDKLWLGKEIPEQEG